MPLPSQLSHLLRSSDQGVLAVVAAAVATTIVAVTGKAADVDLVVAGTKILVPQFTIATLIAGLIGLGVAVLERRGKLPRRSFLIASVAGAVLSMGGPLSADATSGTKVTLAIAHVDADIVVIPRVQSLLARR